MLKALEALVTVTVRAEDPSGERAERSFTVTVTEVNRDPSLDAIEDRTVAPGGSVSLTPSASDPDRPANTLTFELASGPSGATVDPSTGAFSWTAPGTEGEGKVQAGMATQQLIASLVPKVRSLRQPVIAAVNGAASGGGLALALASDVRLAGASARFNVAFVRLGLSGCDIGVSWLLPRLIGASRAFELMLTGRLIDADEAERLGLVSRVVRDGSVVDAALDVADEIKANSPTGVWMTKEVMWSQLEVGSLQAGIDLENRTQIMTSMSDDMQEAVQAFLEKRPPRFT